MQDDLRAQYIESLKKRIERIDSLADRFRAGNAMAGENIRLLGHSLLGSGASFGFPEISEAGRAVEHAAEEELDGKLQVLKAVLEKVVADNSNDDAGESVIDDRSEKHTGDVGQQRPDKESKKTGNKPLEILIVDDDPEICAAIRSALENLPKKQNFTAAYTGAEAQEIVVKGAFDLIVIDLVLPDRDGRELIREIKFDFKITTPILVLTGIQSDAVRVECMSLGADKYLAKPFYEEDLLSEAKKLLGKKAQRQLTLVPKDGESIPEEEDEDDHVKVLQGHTILLAEDDKSQAALIRQRLIQEGAAVQHVVNGRAAMQELRAQKFSLVILDVRMPLMEGFEVLERIRGELKLGNLPVIMVTAMGGEDDIIKGYDLGATDYILKPFSDVQLIARVKSLLKSRP